MKTRTRILWAVVGGCVGGLTAAAEMLPDRQKLLPLPGGEITARGWAKTMIDRSLAGMAGHYGEFDPEQFEKPGATKEYDAYMPFFQIHIPGWCGEMSGEYRLAQCLISAVTGDAETRKRFRAWMDALLAGQEEDGYLGAYRPGDNRLEDFNAWSAHFYYRALLTEYSRTGEKRILEALHKGLLWFAEKWGGDSKTDYVGPTIIWPAIEVYRLTGDDRLRQFAQEYAEWLDKNGSWDPRNRGLAHAGSFSVHSLEHGVYHQVAYAVRAQLPGILSLANGDDELLAAAVAGVDKHLFRVGWQVTGTPVADWERTSLPSCIGETEYCNFLVWMEYMQWLAQLTGESRWGDLIEKMCFNAAMGARKKDERAISYNTSPNQFRATRTSAREGTVPYYEVYCPCEFAACCTAQSLRLMPSYLAKSVMRTPEGDLAVNAYAPCHVAHNGVEIEIETAYPFEGGVRLHVTAKDAWKGALRLRRPAWATDVRVTRNGKPCEASAQDGWLALAGPWADDRVEVAFGMKPVVRAARERYLEEPLRAVECGPLVFTQPLKEKWTAVPQDKGASRYPLPEGWTWFDVTCAEKPVVYAMPLATAFHAESIQVKRTPCDGYPWDNPPVRLVVPMVRTSDAYGPAPEEEEKNPYPKMNPVRVKGAATEAVEFVPFGCTTLRITSFPLACPDEP